MNVIRSSRSSGVRLALTRCLLLAGMASRAQSQGPLSPTAAANNAGIGSNAWSTPGNALVSDNNHATTSAKGITNYLITSDYGFSIPSPSAINGIQLEVERSTNAPNNVALLDAWNTGLTRSVSAGTNRCLVVTYAQENGIDSRDLTALTYGGRSMTQVAQVTAGISGGFTARLEVWILLEAELALAGSTTLVPTFGTYSPWEYCDAFSSAVFQHVDQLSPVLSQQSGGAQGTTDPHQLSTAFSTLAGGMAIHLVTCGNRDASNPAPNTNTTSYATPTGYTEGTDFYFANSSAAPNTGACMQLAHKSIATAGTEQPACDFNGSVNRYAMIGLCLQRARELDHSVRLLKGGALVGSDLANSTSWPTTDTYVSYGGIISTWGTTWTVADINAPGFGAAVAARVQNGTARVDHMRITVYYSSTLPIELLDFRALPDGNTVSLDWVTATETDNDHFTVQRSSDGITFEDVLSLPGAGSSTANRYYHAVDERPYGGLSYYRLKQVDTDGSSSDSPVITVRLEARPGLVAYPNPTADGMITVHDVILERDRVAIFSEDMRLIRTHVGAGRDPIIRLNDLPDGTYILMVSSPDGVRTTKVVKVSREG